jgi:hypothetical protein
VPDFHRPSKGRLQHVVGKLRVAEEAQQKMPKLFRMLDIQRRDDRRVDLIYIASG